MSNFSPKEMLAWAVAMFGPAALNRDERAARVLEEALELAQCEGVSEEVCARLVGRVYSRDHGVTVQEIAGLQFCINTLAENMGINPITEAEIEFIRVSKWPKEYWNKKHGEKIAAGVANLSSPSKTCTCVVGTAYVQPWLHYQNCPLYAPRPLQEWPPKLETKEAPTLYDKFKSMENELRAPPPEAREDE